MFNYSFFLSKIVLFKRKLEKFGRGRQATDHNTIRYMRFVLCITKATNTHSEYVILIAFTRQQCLRERPSLFLYTYVSRLVIKREELCRKIRF